MTSDDQTINPTNPPVPSSPDRETRDSLVSVEEEISSIEQQVAAIKAGRMQSSRQQITLPGGQMMTTGRSGGLSLAQAGAVRIFAHQLQRQRSPQAQLQQQGSRLADQLAKLRPLLVLGCVLLAMVACWPLIQASYQSISQPAGSRQPTAQPATVIQPSATPTPLLPEPTATIWHAGLDAPDSLSIHAGSIDIRLPIRRAEDNRPQPLRIMAPPAGVVIHYGSYPGEAGNLVLLGGWSGFGEGLAELQLNDRVLITNRSSQTYVYRITACSPDGRIECVVPNDNPALALGTTAAPTLTLVAYTGSDNYMIQARFEQMQVGQH